MKIEFKEVKKARIEILPLIDIVFLLLVFFIYAMLSMAVHRGLNISLPESSHAQISKDTAIVITIKFNNFIYIENEKILISSITNALIQKSKNNAKPKIQLFADENVTYKTVFSVLNKIKDAGIDDISLQAKVEN
jgi:biopolymer transport protein ExbD